jgi:hypothetical protein
VGRDEGGIEESHGLPQSMKFRNAAILPNFVAPMGAVGCLQFVSCCA